MVNQTLVKFFVYFSWALLINTSTGINLICKTLAPPPYFADEHFLLRLPLFRLHPCWNSFALVGLSPVIYSRTWLYKPWRQFGQQVHLYNKELTNYIYLYSKVYFLLGILQIISLINLMILISILWRVQWNSPKIYRIKTWYVENVSWMIIKLSFVQVQQIWILNDNNQRQA